MSTSSDGMSFEPRDQQTPAAPVAIRAPFLANSSQLQAFVYQASVSADPSASLVFDSGVTGQFAAEFAAWFDLLDPYRPSSDVALASPDAQSASSALAASSIADPHTA